MGGGHNKAVPVSHFAPETPVFTENRCEFATFLEGRCGHRPLQMKFDRPFVPSIFIRRILAATTVFPAELSDFANVGRIREIYIPRRRGRCLHRPAGNGRFMAVFRRTCADFPFRAVGVDAHIDPQETAVLWRFSGESVLIPIVHRRGGRPCPPAENPAFLEEFSANSQHFNGPMWASAPTIDLAKRRI